MEQFESREQRRSPERVTEITRRNFLGKVALCSLLLTAPSCMPHYVPKSEKDYACLAAFMRLDKKQEPLFVFNDFETELDEESHRKNLDYFRSHPALMDKIRNELGSEEFQWKIESFKRRLLFVPEQRKDYASLFQAYCHDVIAYTLDKIERDSPYASIQTLLREKPDTTQKGMTAFLVHNLARECDAVYSFYNAHKAVKIDLGGKAFIGLIGSYTTTIQPRGDGTFEFKKDMYTIWQNSAKNTYTALTVPAEETLHIVLRERTHEAIEKQLELACVKSTQEVKKIVKEWVAVEEAVVGGVVHALIPDFVKRYVSNVPASLIEKDLQSKCELDRYCNLLKCVDLVGSMGCKEAIKLYENDPLKVKKLLM